MVNKTNIDWNTSSSAGWVLVFIIFASFRTKEELQDDKITLQSNKNNTMAICPFIISKWREITFWFKDLRLPKLGFINF